MVRIRVAVLGCCCCIGAAGASVINFDWYDASAGPIEALEWGFDIAAQGVPIIGYAPGWMPCILDPRLAFPNAPAKSTSPYNVLANLGPSTENDFVFVFSTDVSAVSFSRPLLSGSVATPVVHPAWRLTAFDAQQNEITHIESAAVRANSRVDAATYGLTGPAIHSIMFTSYPTAESTFPSLLLDNLTLTPIPAGSTLGVLGIGFSMSRRRRRRVDHTSGVMSSLSTA